MRIWPKEKRLVVSIALVSSKSYRGPSRMISIGKIPDKSKAFFRRCRDNFSRPAWRHFWQLVLALCLAPTATIDRLSRCLRGSTHRTNHGEFFWRSSWSESDVLCRIALDSLRRLRCKRGGPAYLILDETHVMKKARRMDGIRFIYDSSSRRSGWGHALIKACLWYRGVTIPWGTWMFLKPEHARALGVRHRKQTELVAEAIQEAQLPSGLEVVVLFDAFFLCGIVTAACAQRGWHYVSMGKTNRSFLVGGVVRKLGHYGRNVLRRSGRWMKARGLRQTQKYRLAERIGYMTKLSPEPVKVVFSRRRGDRNRIALVTDDLRMSMPRVVEAYLKRWAIELLIKDEKQQLGLGDYRVLRYRAVMRHLHLVDIAYACLTHAALGGAGAQGPAKAKEKVLRLPPGSQRKAQMRQVLWNDMLADVIRHSHDRLVIRRLEKLLVA